MCPCYLRNGPSVAVLLSQPTVPPSTVPLIARRTLCEPAVLLPALPLVVLVDGVDMSFLRRLITSVLRHGFQCPFFGIRAVLQRPVFGVALWLFFGVRAVLRCPLFGVVLWLLLEFCYRAVSKSS